MRGLIVASALFFGACFTSMAFAERSPQFDFRFHRNNGNIVVVDSFGIVGKSEIPIEMLVRAVKKNEELSMAVLELQKKIEELEKKLRDLERGR